MKKLLFALCLTLGFSSQASVDWHTSLEQAKKLALASNKLILVDFWTTRCELSTKMINETWSDPEVEALSVYYVPLKIDIDKQKSISSHYNVHCVQAVIILDGNGKVLFRRNGYMDKEEVTHLMREYALKTGFVENETMNYSKDKNYVTALLLAKKYLDFALYLENHPRHNFLNLAEKYLKEGADLLEKDQTNYEMMKQKVVLLKLVSEMHKRYYKRVHRELMKMNKEKIHKNNKTLYYYLNYCSSKALNWASSKRWHSKLADNKMVLKKADLLLYGKKSG